MLDLRLPSGLFFAITGILLIGFAIAEPETRAPLTTTNVNLYAGAVMTAFGLFLLLLAFRGKKA